MSYNAAEYAVGWRFYGLQDGEKTVNLSQTVFVSTGNEAYKRTRTHTYQNKMRKNGVIYFIMCNCLNMIVSSDIASCLNVMMNNIYLYLCVYIYIYLYIYIYVRRRLKDGSMLHAAPSVVILTIAIHYMLGCLTYFAKLQRIQITLARIVTGHKRSDHTTLG